MEVNDQNLNILKNLLQNTLSADSKLRKDAENYLINSETQHGFIIVLLHLISKLLNSQDLNDKAVRLAAAVLFKNSIKRNWYNKEEETNFINENDKTLVKTHLIDLMCTAPSDIQRQLAEAVTIISKYDFPKKWNGVMLTANSIMKKFRNVAKSDELFNLPEIFEDNIDNWMNEFLFYLSYKNNVLVSNKEVPGSVEKLQAAIIDNLNLYASKYDEEFNPYLPQFTQSIWQLLIQVITIEPKFDILATNAIKFLISISNKPRNVGLFNESIVKDIIENIVIRNIICVEHDEELFNDNPVDYIRKDIEGSDQDSPQLLSSRLGSSTGLSNSYRALFPPLLTPSMWERKGNVPALIDLLKAYISVGMNEIIAGNHLVGILGVFQKLLSNKSTEVHAFSLLVSIIQHNTTATLSPYQSTVFNLLLIRMQDQLKDNNKTPKYCKYFIHFIALFSFLHSSEKLNEIFESLTPGLLDKIEMKQMIVGFTRLLVSPVLLSRSDAWIAVLKYVLLLVNAESGKTIVDSDDLTFIDEEAEAREFDSTYSKLLYATLPPPVSSVEVAAASAYFIKSLAEFTSKYPGQYTTIIQTGLDAKMMTELQELLQLNGLTLM
eukprot:gene20253-26295_t